KPSAPSFPGGPCAPSSPAGPCSPSEPAGPLSPTNESSHACSSPSNPLSTAISYADLPSAPPLPPDTYTGNFDKCGLFAIIPHLLRYPLRYLRYHRLNFRYKDH